MIGDILQPTHLIFILIVALVVLGPKRLPEVGRSLGRGLRDFKYALSSESPEHDYSPPPEPYSANQPEHEAPASGPPAEPAVGHGARSPGSGESAPPVSAPPVSAPPVSAPPAATGPAEHAS